MFELYFIKPFVGLINAMGNHWVYPVLIGSFLAGVLVRGLIYYTVRRHEWFALEFEKRVSRFLDKEDRDSTQSFFVMTKKLLERTFYEIFEQRDRIMRRRPDHVMTVTDRIFLIRQGAAWIVRDTIKQAQYIKWGENPNFSNITKTVFHKNPCFNRLFGLVSASGVNDILNILPSLFVIVGIFGTFIGVMKGLPTLMGINVQDVEATRQVMDGFVEHIAMSMGASVLGIFCSVMMNISNTMMAPEKAFVGVVDRFENSLILLWNRANNNNVPKDGRVFDEHRDPAEALAEAALNQELARRKVDRDSEGLEPRIPKPRAS